MRLVEVLIPDGKRGSVLEVLDAEEIDYAVWHKIGRGDFEAVVQVPYYAVLFMSSRCTTSWHTLLIKFFSWLTTSTPIFISSTIPRTIFQI